MHEQNQIIYVKWFLQLKQLACVSVNSILISS